MTINPSFLNEMLLYRIGDELHLNLLLRDTGEEAYPNEEEAMKREDSMIYDGSYGPPDRFYLSRVIAAEAREGEDNDFFDTNGLEDIYCVVIYRPGMVLFNLGSYTKIKKSLWISYETEKLDYPIGYQFIIRFSENRSFIVVGFIYPDISMIIVELERDGSFEIVTTQALSENEIREQDLVLPLEFLQFRTRHRSFIVKDSKKPCDAYSFEFAMSYEDDDSYSCAFDKIDKIRDANLDLIQINEHKYNLYSDGHLEIEPLIGYKNISKVSDDGELLLSEDTLMYMARHSKKWIVRDKISRVINFYYRNYGDGVYLIHNDQLLLADVGYLHKIRRHEVIIERNASQIKFPTNTKYDIDLNTSSQTKSARKR